LHFSTNVSFCRLLIYPHLIDFKKLTVEFENPIPRPNPRMFANIRGLGRVCGKIFGGYLFKINKMWAAVG